MYWEHPEFEVCTPNMSFIYEVDLDYPTEIHDKTKFYPFAPEKIDGKLMLTQNNKRNYIVEGSVLEFYMRQF